MSNAQGLKNYTKVSLSAMSGVTSAGRSRGMWTDTWICRCQSRIILVPVTKSWLLPTVHLKWRLKTLWDQSILKGTISMSAQCARKKLMLPRVSSSSHCPISLLSNSTGSPWTGLLFRWLKCMTEYLFHLSWTETITYKVLRESKISVANWLLKKLSKFNSLLL